MLHQYADKEGQQRLYDLYYFKEEIEKMICSDGRWEKYKDYFATKRNFTFDRDGNITFDIYRISKVDGEYVPDGSDIANKHFLEVLPQLDELTKIERYIESLCAEHKDEIARVIEVNRKSYSMLYGAAAHLNFMDEERDTKNCYYFYGNEGKKLIIKWLNKLTESESIEELLPSYLKDVNEVVERLEILQYGPYLTSKELGLKMENMLLAVMERYSNRAKSLRFAYFTQKIEGNKKTV
jgi:hypothetical protein